MNIIRQFLKLESAGGILLLITVITALLVSNTSLSIVYKNFFTTPFLIRFGAVSIEKDFLFWINQGLMTLFFLLIGLELKREFVEGELSDVKKIILPLGAALGGMIIPAMLYCFVNWHSPASLKGWPVPVATDIAFALGALSCFGKRVPYTLKLFLLMLAIFDDVGGIIIIAFFPGSGIHTSIAGVLLALIVPLPLAKKLETVLHPWVAFLIVPLFAFANSGISFAGMSANVLLSVTTLGIIAGLFLGKQVGIMSFVWLMIKCNIAKLPTKTDWRAFYGVSILCGIGFTMSLFLGTLIFGGNADELAQVRLGVLMGSFLSVTMGMLVLRTVLKKS